MRKIKTFQLFARLYQALFVGLAVISLFTLQPTSAQSPTALPQADREARWREDLKFFADEFASHQMDFSKLYPPTAFKSELAEIAANLSKLTDVEITLRLMRLVASANVAHTMVGLPIFRLGFRQLPLEFYWYSDGLAVTAATSAYSAALGTRVLRIGAMTPDQLLTAVAPYISHENSAGLRDQSTGYLKTLAVLQHLGAAGADGRVEFTLAKPGGEPFTLTVSVGDPRVKLVSALDALQVTALYRKHPESYYWYEYLADAQALYIQYNRCQNDPQLAFKDFARDLFAFADAHPVQRVVVDLRFNGGGNSLVIYPLMLGLKARAALRSHLYVLIGARTFSSAEDAALDFRREFQATLIGEPTSGKPNSYGEVKTLTLPNSKLTVQYSTKYYQMIKDADPSALEPDLRVPRTLADALAGRDPALDAALRHPAR